MMEKPPRAAGQSAVQILSDPVYASVIDKINDEYLYWDKVKYHVPEGLDVADFWNAVKLSRKIGSVKCSFCSGTFTYKETRRMQEILHGFDTLSFQSPQKYLASSLMEEAIASSRMEGAATTRVVAKEMLLRQAKPKDTSQQMIVNNYQAIRFLVSHTHEDFSPELLLEIHKRITEKTLDDPRDEGRFRTDNTIHVVDGISGEIFHEPPPCSMIPEAVAQLGTFINSDSGPFMHPIIKAILVHFMVSYLHPFVDGNGRTARALFYWYMLKQGYWMTQYLSISRIIYRSKSMYEKAFLATENDELDVGYFIQYHLQVLRQALEAFQDYLERKAQETNACLEYRIPGLNERQAELIRLYAEQPSALFSSKELVTRFAVSVKTIRSDLETLVRKGLLEPVPLNKRLVGYARSKEFSSILATLRA